MNRTPEMLTDLDKRISELRQHVLRNHTCVGLIHCRLDAVEDHTNDLTRSLAEIRTTLDKSAQLLRSYRKLCDGRRDANANALGEIQDLLQPVLDSHTTSIFRLTAELQLIQEQFNAAGSAPITPSNTKDLTDNDRANPKDDVDRTKRVINTTATNAGDGLTPLRT